MQTYFSILRKWKSSNQLETMALWAVKYRSNLPGDWCGTWNMGPKRRTSQHLCAPEREMHDWMCALEDGFPCWSWSARPYLGAILSGQVWQGPIKAHVKYEIEVLNCAYLYHYEDLIATHWDKKEDCMKRVFPTRQKKTSGEWMACERTKPPKRSKSRGGPTLAREQGFSDHAKLPTIVLI